MKMLAKQSLTQFILVFIVVFVFLSFPTEGKGDTPTKKVEPDYAEARSKSWAGLFSSHKTEFNLHDSTSIRSYNLEELEDWVGIQVGQYLTKYFELLGSADVMLYDAPGREQLLQGNCAYNIGIKDKIVVFVIGGIGFHRCNEPLATTPMINLGAGIRTNSNPAIRFEYKAHIKFNEQVSKQRWNFTQDDLHLISIGISFFPFSK